jgi:hypothetical protein
MSHKPATIRPVVAAVLVAVSLAATPASAESYASLLKHGYKTGKISRGKSGALGWIVSNGEKRYFCTMRAALAYGGSQGMVGFTSSGKQMNLNRKVFEANLGGPDPTIPQLADLKAGRPDPRDVGSCAPARS